jgi:hypothetical protein
VAVTVTPLLAHVDRLRTADDSRFRNRYDFVLICAREAPAADGATPGEQVESLPEQGATNPSESATIGRSVAAVGATAMIGAVLRKRGNKHALRTLHT